MKNWRLKQMTASFLVVLSLFVSSVSACGCSRHQESTEADSPSCHEHSQKEKVENNDGANSAETIQTVISETECCCVSPAPKALAKSETVKIEKQSLAILPTTPIKIAFVQKIVLVESEFTTPFYLTDSFHNLTPGRAPPVL